MPNSIYQTCLLLDYAHIRGYVCEQSVFHEVSLVALLSASTLQLRALGLPTLDQPQNLLELLFIDL